MKKSKTPAAGASSAPRSGSTCITDFLKTNRSKKDLMTALAVLREFKGCESMEEWAFIQFAAWAKLEQLQEFLEHLCEGKPLADDTKAYIKRMSNAEHHARPERSERT
jgi:hypothetical protein